MPTCAAPVPEEGTEAFFPPISTNKIPGENSKTENKHSGDETNLH